MSTKHTVLGFDPGTTNFAYAVLTAPKRVHEAGWVPVYKKAGDIDALQKILRKIRKLVKTHKPDLVLMERFMFRGGGSVAAELMNHVIGACIVLFESLGVAWKILPAAQWKNYATKHWGYENDAKSKGRARALAKKLFPRLKDVDAIHMIDAACMARYGFEKKLIPVKGKG